MNSNIQNQLYYLESKIKEVESQIYQIDQACRTGQYNPYDPNVQQMMSNYNMELNNLRQQYDNVYRNYVNYNRQQNYSNYNSQYNTGYQNNNASHFEPYSYRYEQDTNTNTYSSSTPGNRFEDPDYQRKTLGSASPVRLQETPGSPAPSSPIVPRGSSKVLKEELTLLSSDLNYKILPSLKFTKNHYNEEEVKAVSQLIRKLLKERGKELTVKTLIELQEILLQEREHMKDPNVFQHYQTALNVIKHLLGHIQLLLNKLFSIVCGMEKNVIKQLTVQNLDYLLSHKEQLKFPNLGEVLIRIDNDLRKTLHQESNGKLERVYTEVITFDKEVSQDFHYKDLEIHMELRDEVITVGPVDTPKTYQVLQQLLRKTPGFTYIDVRSDYGELFFYVVVKGDEILLIRK